MTNDILPSSVSNFLDNVEATLCLPILLVIIFFTLQFIINHTLDIICTIMSVMDGSIDDEPDLEDYNTPVGARMRGMFCDIASSLMPGESMIHQTTAALSSPISVAKTNFRQFTGESMGSR